MTHAPHREAADHVAFMPGVRGHDAMARHWLAQVTLRLRREVCWLWRERGLQSRDESPVQGAWPPLVDRSLAALDLVRYEHDKRRFFSEDPTARYLTERLAALPTAGRSHPSPGLNAELRGEATGEAREPRLEFTHFISGIRAAIEDRVHPRVKPENDRRDEDPIGDARRGSFGWVAKQLDLSPEACFVLALALLPSVDSAAGPVIASCLNDATRTSPTLALAQRLWDDPEDVLRCFDPAHPLLSHGLIVGPVGGVEWDTALRVPSLVARELLFAGGVLPSALRASKAAPLPAALSGAAKARVATALAADSRTLIPMLGASGTALAGVAAALVRDAGGSLVQPSASLPRDQFGQALAAAWLRGHALFIDAATLTDPGAHEHALAPPPLPALPLTILIGAADKAALRGLGETAPAIEVPALSYAERLEVWRAEMPDPALASFLPEAARRFRYEQPAIARVAAELRRLGRPPAVADMLAAARADLDLGTLAQPVTPRFRRDELMLPPAQSRQVDDIVKAMGNLTRVHYEWGTAKPWNEGGLTALFAGPPGTGKTMAAEAIAEELSLPLHRIDLSQVVNKYIGETEKNLRHLFDAADAADIILFFDEADALFGKRTEVKDAHDRYANLEISYLLERMERFKGLAILATNRRKDLDEAFMRRLRFVLEFPLPGPDERLRIWQSVIPPGVDASGLDFDFLARRFALAGGHIRAIVFQACLQSAAKDAPRTLEMPAIVRAVQREYEKLERANSLDQFGPYAVLVASERNQR